MCFVQHWLNIRHWLPSVFLYHDPFYLNRLISPYFSLWKNLTIEFFFNQWVTCFPKAAYGKLAFRTMRRGCYLWNPDLDSVAAMETESGYLGLVVKFGTNILWKKYWLSNDFYPLWFSTFLFEKFAITSCVKLVPEIPVKPYTRQAIAFCLSLNMGRCLALGKAFKKLLWHRIKRNPCFQGKYSQINKFCQSSVYLLDLLQELGYLCPCNL